MAPIPLALEALEGAAVLLEGVAALVILGGGAIALLGLFHHRDAVLARQSVSNTLLLALDFTIGADVLKVAAAPDLARVGVVGGVVAIRIALTGALLWELRGEARKKSKPA